MCLLSYLAGKSHTSAHDETVRSPRAHHAELALLDKGNQVSDLVAELWVLEVLGLVRVGILDVGVGERRHLGCACSVVPVEGGVEFRGSAAYRLCEWLSK